MTEPALTADLLTYSEAAEVTGFSRNYIANLVSQGTLHPKRLEGRHSKYLLKEEVQWLQRRKSGVNEPNPFAESAQTTPETSGVDLSALDAVVRKRAASPEAAIEDEPVVGLMLILLVLGLLLALVQQKQLKHEELERFKRAPELKPLRQAILRLAGELDAA